MARKRSNKEAVQKIENKKGISPLTQSEAKMLQGFADASVTFDKLLKQKSQYEFAISSMEKTRKKIQDGEIPEIIVTIAPNTTAPITDKKEMLKHLDDQIHSLKTALLGIKGQVEQKQDLYIERGLVLKKWCDNRFSPYKPTDITSNRKTLDDEKVLFEQALDDLDPEAFEAARKKAIKLNKEKEQTE